MSTYENAPATKLLATNCACCGRALVDAVSVETGVGPDCREMHGYAEAQGDADWARADRFLDGAVMLDETQQTPREAVNILVHRVARSAKTIDKNFAAAIFNAIDALGFSVLAERIAKRFHATLEARLTEEQVATLRAEYAKLRAAYCFQNGNATPADFDVAVKALVPTGPADFVECAKNVTCECKACDGSGEYRRYHARNHEGGTASACYRCSGKGRQSQADVDRNRAYDALRGRRGRAA